MQYDFLRHIVNPILNKYIEKGVSIKVVSDIKKMFQHAENIYRFSVYNGDVSNLIKFLYSTDFLNIMNTFKTNDLSYILVEILEETKKKYSSNKDIANAIDTVLYDLGRDTGVLNESTRFELRDFLSKKLNPIKIRSFRDGLKITLRENIVVKIKPAENNIDVEIIAKKSFPKRDIWKIPEMVKVIEEKINSI